MFWRDMTLSIWRKKTTGLKTKKRLLPLMLAAALCSSPVWAEEATFTANFKDTDLKSFIETVGANLNKTIIMGPGVQGKVSIRTMTPLNERQYYQLFLNLLEAQGYAVVPMENDVLKVVKSSAAKSSRCRWSVKAVTTTRAMKWSPKSCRYAMCRYASWHRFCAR